jgi:hypothetical protein
MADAAGVGEASVTSEGDGKLGKLPSMYPMAWAGAT